MTSEENKARCKAYDATHRDEKKARGAAYYAAHREAKKAYAAAHRPSTEEYREYEREYRARNPEKIRAKSARRRALKLGAEGTHTAADVKAIYEKQDGKCYWCGKHVGKDYHVDHFMPLSKGGTNWPDNLVIACPQCNFSKGAKLPDEWSK